MNHTLRVGILPTKVDRTSALAREFLAALDQSFGERLLSGISADPEVVKAPMLYEPVTRSFPKAEITFAPDPGRARIVDSWPGDVDDARARADWGWCPEYDLDRAFDAYLVPAVRARYQT